MNVLEKVNECLEKYHGGEIFFDELDKMLKFDEETLKNFMRVVGIETWIHNQYTIASGEFGLCIHNYCLDVDIIVQGGLRNGNAILDLSKFVVPGHRYLFLDDSYFSGATAEVVKKEVERCGGVFDGCYVIYDGSKEPIHNVKSIYRYYDHH